MSNLSTRDHIVQLCQEAGVADLRIAEIEHGCNANRMVRILIGQLDSGLEGTLTLSNPRAAVKALDLAIALQIDEEREEGDPNKALVV